jgi:hypothetical protein
MELAKKPVRVKREMAENFMIELKFEDLETE